MGGGGDGDGLGRGAEREPMVSNPTSFSNVLHWHRYFVHFLWQTDVQFHKLWACSFA